MSRAVLSIGSNLGDRLAFLRSAVDDFADALVAASSAYETAPFGVPDPQPAYLNAVLVVHSDVDARGWLARARAAEAAAGRRRAARWGPRTLDVDVVTVADPLDVRSDDPELTLPHPRAHERAFVLAPWLEVEPGAVLPGYGRVADLLRRVGTAGITRREDLTLR